MRTLTLALLLATHASVAQSTEDLSFLIGEWDLKHIYSPGTENENTYRGTLSCEKAVDGQYIRCEYVIGRVNTSEGITVGYFNYNKIYEKYEAISMSSTWPIKVITQGTLTKSPGKLSLDMSTEFPIANDVMEYVKTSVSFDSSTNTMTKETFIRTSEQPEWRKHMEEVAVKKN